LTKKAKRVASMLREKGIHVGPGAVSANFIRGSRHVDADSAPGEMEFLQYAFGLLSEYISIDLCLLLRKALALPEESNQGINEHKKV
jgi:ribonuclease H2 subunit B